MVFRFFVDDDGVDGDGVGCVVLDLLLLVVVVGFLFFVCFCCSDVLDVSMIGTCGGVGRFNNDVIEAGVDGIDGSKCEVGIDGTLTCLFLDLLDEGSAKIAEGGDDVSSEASGDTVSLLFFVETCFALPPLNIIVIFSVSKNKLNSLLF